MNFPKISGIHDQGSSFPSIDAAEIVERIIDLS